MLITIGILPAEYSSLDSRRKRKSGNFVRVPNNGRAKPAWRQGRKATGRRFARETIYDRHMMEGHDEIQNDKVFTRTRTIHQYFGCRMGYGAIFWSTIVAQDEEQKRCVGLEIAYEASSQCSVGTRPDGQSYFPPFHPAWGALESFFDAGFEDVHTVNDCFALCDVARPADSGISRHCCEKICSHAYDVQVNNIGSCPN
jgi:hypothetical protein